MKISAKINAYEILSVFIVCLEIYAKNKDNFITGRANVIFYAFAKFLSKIKGNF